MNPNNRNLSFIAFFLGLAAVTWIALGYVGGSTLALGVSCVIAAVYVVGAFEMRRFHGDTAALAGALDRIPDDITDVGEWLQQVPATLRNAVRLRIEGERIALPGPGVTPYLVGLLVLLGMLGTFLGMVVTLNGAVLALESTTDQHTIRSALAAPVQGLGVAFGTSVAGVATSAMLGLISTDLTLSEEEIIQTYGKRWNIEVFFKMCKSYLKLGKETRSISYDALTAHTAIVFARYMMLALEQRRNMDERSLGELFYLTMDELEDLHYLDALASLLSLLMDCAKEAEILDEEQVNQLLDLFMAKLPDLWGKCLKQCA